MPGAPGRWLQPEAQDVLCLPADRSNPRLHARSSGCAVQRTAFPVAPGGLFQRARQGRTGRSRRVRREGVRHRWRPAAVRRCRDKHGPRAAGDGGCGRSSGLVGARCSQSWSVMGPMLGHRLVLDGDVADAGVLRPRRCDWRSRPQSLCARSRQRQRPCQSLVFGLYSNFRTAAARSCAWTHVGQGYLRRPPGDVEQHAVVVVHRHSRRAAMARLEKRALGVCVQNGNMKWATRQDIWPSSFVRESPVHRALPSRCCAPHGSAVDDGGAHRMVVVEVPRA